MPCILPLDKKAPNKKTYNMRRALLCNPENVMLKDRFCLPCILPVLGCDLHYLPGFPCKFSTLGSPQTAKSYPLE